MYGQDAFRRFERRALARVLKQHARAVIAAGGSLVTDPATYQLLQEQCFCVWLRAARKSTCARHRARRHAPLQGRSAALVKSKSC